MAKRNTRGRPRKERDLESRRTYRSKAERDRLLQQRALLVAGIAVLFIVGILGVAVIREYVWLPRSTITTVDGVEIKTGDYQKRVRAERWYQANEVRQLVLQQQLFGGQFQQGQDPFAQQINILLGEMLDTEGFGEQVLQDMELQVLLEAEAERRGIEINEDEIQAQVDEYILRNTGLSITPTPTREPTEFSPTQEPLITATPLPPSATPTITPLPTTAGCEEGEDCPTVTPLPTATATPEITNTPTPSNTPIPQDNIRETIERFEDERIYADAEDVAKIDREILRDVFYFQALQVALREAIGNERIESGDISDQRLAVSSRHILISVPGERPTFDEALCESEEWLPYRQEAEAAIDLLENGEPFALLAETISDDTGSAVNGGLLGDVNNVDTSNYVEEFKQGIREAELGEYYGPVCTQFGFHIIQLLEKTWEDLSESELNTSRNQAYNEWTNDLLTAADIQRESGWEDRIEDTPTLEDLLGDIYSFAGNTQVSTQ
jgi:parvulin-like peptidyl-prolyl isomerase